MARNPIQSQTVASGVDLTSDPVQMPLNRARGMVNLQNDRLGVLRTDLSLSNQLAVPAINVIDGVGFYYAATIHSIAPGQLPDLNADLLVWVTNGLLALGVPNADPINLPVSFPAGLLIQGSGVTGYTGGLAFFIGKRVRFASLNSELLMVQEGGLLLLRFYATQALGGGFFRAGIEPPNVTGGTFQVPALAIDAVGAGLTGTWEYKLTFADERFRESSPTPALSITLANQGTRAKYRTDYTRADGTTQYGGSNLAYAYLYRNTIGTPDTFYQIARATIPMFLVNPVTFVAADFYFNPSANNYDFAPDSAIVGSVLAPNPGENDPPNPASVICVWKNRVLCNDVTNSSVVQISNLLSPTQWTLIPTTPFVATDGIRPFVGTDQGDPITAIVDFGSYAAIFKRRQVFFLSGNSISDFLIQPVHTRGCISPDSAVRCDNFVFFLSDDGVYAASYSGGESVAKVSKEIEAQLLSLTQKDRESSKAWFVDNCYHLSIGTVTFIYSFDVQAWTTYQFGPGFAFGGSDSGIIGSTVINESGGGGGSVGGGDQCSVTISPTSESVVTAGSAFDVDVTAANSATIGYTSSAAWVHLSGGPTNGSGTLTVTVDENTVDPQRTATVGICGQVLTIVQDAAGPPQGCVGTGGGLVHQWKADAGVFSDAGTTPAVNLDTAQQWNDQVGTLNLSQATVGFRPVFKTGQQNGLPALSFDGIDDWIQTGAFNLREGLPDCGDGWSIFVVAKLKTWRSENFMWGFGPTSGPRYQGTKFSGIGGVSPEGGIYAGGRIGTDGTQPADLHPGDYCLIGWFSNNNSINNQYLVNGGSRQLGVVDLLEAVGAKFTIGSSLDGGGNCAEIDAAEILMYQGSLSDAQVLQVQTYLNNRWGIF